MSGPASRAAVPTTENCRFCWMCRHACPVGHVSHKETYTPHAWALTIESVKRGQLVWNDESVGVLYACADCGLCQAHCATDQPLPDAIVAARAGVVAAGAAPQAVREYETRLRQQLARPMERPAMERPAFRPADASVTRPADAADLKVGRSIPVALFVGDTTPQRTIDAALALVGAAGLAAAPVGAGRSTGAVAASLGLRDTAVACAEAVLDELSTAHVAEVLVLTPGDRWAFEHVYSRRLGLAWPSGLAVREVTSVLARAHLTGELRFRQTPPDASYAYHDPCHTARVQRDDSAVRALLETALGHAGRKLFWRERRAHPCGATSGLDLTHPDLAASLADARLADAAAAGATTIITEDTACVRHLQSRARPGVTVASLYEVLADRL